MVRFVGVLWVALFVLVCTAGVAHGAEGMSFRQFLSEYIGELLLLALMFALAVLAMWWQIARGVTDGDSSPDD